MKIHEYKGKDITIFYDLHRCIHAAECVHGASSVFNPEAKPWITPEKAPAGEIATIIQRCPTGALHYQAADPTLAERTEPSNIVTTSPNGPLYLRGNITVITTDGREILSDSRLALCRCGASKRKPLCDNSHLDAGFADSGMAQPEEEAEKDMAAGGKLMVNPRTNGPLHLKGRVTIKNAGGTVIFEGTETWLCRCGASASKPFCDGTHKRIGFKSEEA